jgi:hypothetical protein
MFVVSAYKILIFPEWPAIQYVTLCFYLLQFYQMKYSKVSSFFKHDVIFSFCISSTEYYYMFQLKSVH